MAKTSNRFSLAMSLTNRANPSIVASSAAGGRDRLQWTREPFRSTKTTRSVALMFTRGRRFNGLRAAMDLGLAVVLLGGCLTAEAVAAKLRGAQVDVGAARIAAEHGDARGDPAAALANAVAALRALGDAQAWVDAYATAHGPRASDQFEPALRRIAADAAAARASALKTGATPQSIDAQVNRERSRAQAGAGGGGGGAGAGGSGGM